MECKPPLSYNVEPLAETLSYVKMHHFYQQGYSYLLHTTLLYGGGNFLNFLCLFFIFIYINKNSSTTYLLIYLLLVLCFLIDLSALRGFRFHCTLYFMLICPFKRIVLSISFNFLLQFPRFLCGIFHLSFVFLCNFLQ